MINDTHLTYAQDGTPRMLTIDGTEHSLDEWRAIIASAAREQIVSTAYHKQQSSYRELEVLYQDARSEETTDRPDRWPLLLLLALVNGIIIGGALALVLFR